MNVINLAKGQIIDLSKISTSKKYEFRAKWDIGAIDADIDITAVLCGSNSNAVVASPEYLAFYNNPVLFGGAVIHQGDSKVGGSGSWDEIISFDFEKMPSNVKSVPLIITIHESAKTGLNFGLVKNLTVSIYDLENNKEVAEFRPDSTNSLNTALILGEFLEGRDGYSFKANGLGRVADLSGMLSIYGFQTTN
ncbi:MAG: TerD family protein [Paraclostridium sp.]